MIYNIIIGISVDFCVTSSLRFILETFSNPHVETRNSIPYQVQKKLETGTSKMEFRALKYNRVKTNNFVILSTVSPRFGRKTVDGRNPAPVARYFIALVTGSYIYPRWFFGMSSINSTLSISRLKMSP